MDNTLKILNTFTLLKNEVRRMHENEDCSELAERGCTCAGIGRVITLRHSNKLSPILIPTDKENKVEVVPFEYHTVLYIAGHIFDPDYKQGKVVPLRKYIEELSKLGNPLQNITCNDRKVNTQIKKVYYRELRQQEQGAVFVKGF